jgi:hypothetical protein
MALVAAVEATSFAFWGVVHHFDVVPDEVLWGVQL